MFIENISNSVRINNIVESIFIRSRRVLLENNNYHQEIEPVHQEWYFYKADEGGYFQSIAINRLLKILKSRSLVLKVIPYFGDYLHKEHHLFCLNKKVDDKKLLNMIRGSFNIFSGENVQENYFYGFRQLREVAVKALSPGINDPGIAIICLDYLSELLAIYMDHETKVSIKGEDGKAIVILKRHSFSTMINLTLSPITSYGKKDYLILCHLLKVIGNISLYDKVLANKNCLIAHANAVLDAGNKGISSKLERACLNDVVKELSKSKYFDLNLLSNDQ